MALATSTIIAIAALVVASAGAYKSNQLQQEAARDQRQAQKVSQAQQDAERQQQIRTQVRQDRIKKAQILQASQDTGVAQSSGEGGAIGSIGTQTASNIGTITQSGLAQDSYNSLQQQAADSMSAASTWQAIGSVGSSIFNVSSGMRSTQTDYAKLFGTPYTGINPPKA